MRASTHKANIETLVAWLDAMRRKDFDSAIEHFAPDVVWEGLAPGVECPNRNAVAELLPESILNDLDVTGLELIAAGDRVTLGIRSPQLRELAGVRLNGELWNVFTLERGLIVGARDYRTRAEAERRVG